MLAKEMHALTPSSVKPIPKPVLLSPVDGEPNLGRCHVEGHHGVRSLGAKHLCRAVRGRMLVGISTSTGMQADARPDVFYT